MCLKGETIFMNSWLNILVKIQQELHRTYVDRFHNSTVLVDVFCCNLKFSFLIVRCYHV